MLVVVANALMANVPMVYACAKKDGWVNHVINKRVVKAAFMEHA